MQKTISQATAYRLGIYGAVATIIGILFSGPLSMIMVALIHPQPPWENVRLFTENYHPIQAMPYYAGFFLVIGPVVMIAAMYHIAEEGQKAKALIAIIFIAVFTTLIFFNYINQTTFIPALVKNYRPEYEPFLVALSMNNPTSLAWAIEMWGYGFMGLATWFVAPIFHGSKLERWTAILFIVNGVASIIGALITAADLGWVVTLPGLMSYIAWNILVLMMCILVVLALRRRQKEVASAAEQPALAVAA